MKDLLRKTWREQILNEIDFASQNSEIRELKILKNRNEEKLLENLSDEKRELFIKYSDCENELDGVYFEEAFIEGVRFAVKLFVEAMG